MNDSDLIKWVLGSQGLILGLILKHMFDCRSNSIRITNVERWLRDSLGFRIKDQ